MRKIYYLSTCDTCKRIIKDLALQDKGFDFQDIKKEHVSEHELDEWAKKTGSYNALFSRVARKYKALGLKDKNLSENEIKTYILSDYTFLKRPVILIDDAIVVGNSKASLSIAKELLN